MIKLNNKNLKELILSGKNLKQAVAVVEEITVNKKGEVIDDSICG